MLWSVCLCYWYVWIIWLIYRLGLGRRIDFSGFSMLFLTDWHRISSRHWYIFAQVIPADRRFNLSVHLWGHPQSWHCSIIYTHQAAYMARINHNSTSNQAWMCHTQGTSHGICTVEELWISSISAGVSRNCGWEACWKFEGINYSANHPKYAHFGE